MVRTPWPSAPRPIARPLALVALAALLVIATPTATPAQARTADAATAIVSWGAAGLDGATRAVVDPDPAIPFDTVDDTADGGPDAADPDVTNDPPATDDSAATGDPDPLEADEAPQWDVLDPLAEALPRVNATLVPGTVARLRPDDRAAIPRAVPRRVRILIAQINRIVGKRYKRGGGHLTLVDRGYDGAGAVSFGLVKAGLLRRPLFGAGFARWGQPGIGRWVTVYAKRGHVYMEVAGMRLDTSTVGDDPSRTGVQWRPPTGKRAGFKVRHPAGL